MFSTKWPPVVERAVVGRRHALRDEHIGGSHPVSVQRRVPVLEEPSELGEHPLQCEQPVVVSKAVVVVVPVRPEVLHQGYQPIQERLRVMRTPPRTPWFSGGLRGGPSVATG